MHLRPAFLFCFALALWVSAASAQVISDYSPVTSWAAFSKDLPASILRHAEAEKARGAHGPHKKALAEFYSERAAEIVAGIRDSTYYFDTLVHPFYQRIFSHILASNPGLFGPEVRLLVSRNPVANAYCVGNGVLIYNLALSRKFRREDEVAFVLCHELGHYLMGHVDSSYRHNLGRLDDPAFRRQLAAAKKEKYGSSTRVESLIGAMLYESRRYGRGHEYEADSVAMRLLSRTSYDARQAAPALLALDSSDYERHHGSFDLAAVFGSAAYPFKAEWTASQTNPFFNAAPAEAEVAQADSMKTHPDCAVRAAEVGRLLAANYSPREAPSGQAEFAMQRRTADFEQVENLYSASNFSACIYHAVLLARVEPENAYLVTRIGGALNGCRAALAAHQLHRVVRPPTPFDRGDYKLLAAFLNNLRLSEMSAVTFHFLDRYYSALHTREAFLQEYIIAAHAASQAPKRDAAAEKFNQLFPTSPRRTSLQALH
jgi:Zn-dependent protease with chaperone function